MSPEAGVILVFAATCFCIAASIIAVARFTRVKVIKVKICIPVQGSGMMSYKTRFVIPTDEVTRAIGIATLLERAYADLYALVKAKELSPMQVNRAARTEE